MKKIDQWKENYRNYDPRCSEVDETKYLLENNDIMKEFLKNTNFDFSEGNYFYNKTVPNSKITNRPDHRFEKEKIIIEFDGLQHYQNINVIKNDKKKDNVYSKMGYTIIRIPFFIQPSSETLKYFFNIDKDLTLQYPHGFIHYNSTPPAYFCLLGLERFIEEFKKFPDILQNDIVESMKKLKQLGEEEAYIIPKQYAKIINNCLKKKVFKN